MEIKRVFKIATDGVEKASNWVLDNILKKYNFIIILALLSIFGLVIRVSLLDFQSSDFFGFLQPWVRGIRANGGFKDFGNTRALITQIEFGNPPTEIKTYPPNYDYTTAYLYILTAISYLKDSQVLFAIKWVSIFFDFVIAVFIGLICRKILKSNTAFLFGFALALFLPNAILNSAVWGQCDVIFSCFIIMSLYFILRGNNRTALILCGISFAFKIQAIFFLPVILILIAKKKINLFYILYIFLGFFIIDLPALIMGMGFEDVFITPYSTQIEEYVISLSLNAPNLYLLIDVTANYCYSEFGEPNGAWREWFSSAGVLFAIAVCLILFALIYRKKFSFSSKKLVLIAYLFSMLVPFLLPHMHERYWFLSDMLAIIFIACYPKRFYIAILSIYSSFRPCINFLFTTRQAENWQRLSFALMMLVAILLLLHLLYTELTKSDEEEFIKPLDKAVCLEETES